MMQTRFSDAYSRLVDEAAAVMEPGGRDYGEVLGPRPERLLRCIWYDCLFRSDELRTIDGASLQILSPGRWNLEHGPDFRNAEILLEGRRAKGDIELHLSASNWNAHGHSQDKTYNNVVLHVVLWPPQDVEPVIRQDGGRVPQLALEPFIEDLRELRATIRVEDYPFCSDTSLGRCHEVMASVGKRVETLLDSAGDHRMLMKAERFAPADSRTGEDQTLYEGLMEALGYKSFKVQFLRLAQRARYEELRRVVAREKGKGNKIAGAQAFLFSMAGLLPEEGFSRSVLDDETCQYLAEVEEKWDQAEYPESDDFDSIDWTPRGVRPANLPIRRLAGMAHVVAGTSRHGIFRHFLRVLRGPEPEIVPKLKESLSVGGEDYWTHRYRWGGKRLPSPMKLIGADRASAMIMNVLLPAALAHALRTGDSVLEERVHRVYSSYPKLPSNSITRFMTRRLFGDQAAAGKTIIGSRRQQSLIQIFHDWCVENPGCQNCRIPGFLGVPDATSL